MSIFSAGAMTFAQFLAWASIGRTKAYEEIKAGRLHLVKLGSKSLILRADAEAWLSRYSEFGRAEARRDPVRQQGGRHD
jgi:hypothetical protein